MNDESSHGKSWAFDPDLGPMIGSQPLLRRVEGMFEPRALDDLRAVLGPDRYESLIPGLAAVARALDDRDLCRAAIATGI